MAMALSHLRRVAFAGGGAVTGLATYKSQTDPVHIFWDLDHTILCSLCPIPAKLDGEGDLSNSKELTSKCPVAPSNIASLLPSPPPLRHFDQIDDDFPYDDQTLAPNTRTYFRPGAEMAIKICSCFGFVHVFTAAQETYTNNILDELDSDKTIFKKVLHRDALPQIVKEGKNLNLGADDMRRAILFDDRASNFKPQKYENGIVVAPFTPERVAQCYDGSWNAYLDEVKEMARLVGIAFWSTIHVSGDVRKVVSWVRRWQNGQQ